MQFIDLALQQNRIREKIEKGILTVLDHGQYIMGPEIKQLEKQLAHYCGVSHAVSCASGTDALLLALMAYDVGPGDAVFTSPFTFIATAEVIQLLGATPVFVDIEPATYQHRSASAYYCLVCRQRRPIEEPSASEGQQGAADTQSGDPGRSLRPAG